MVRLLQTYNVTIGRTVKYFGEDYHEIPAIGDGNCALNAFALGLVDLVKRDQLAIAQQRQQEWVAVLKSKSTLNVLRNRLKVYRNRSWSSAETGYEDLADGLEAFIAFIESNDFAYDGLLQYIKDNSQNRLQVAVLHVALAPSLRYIGAVLYKKQLQAIGTDDTSLLSDADNLKKDTWWAGHEILMPLAREFFRVNLTIHDTVENAVYNEEEITDRPTINVVKVPGHWNFCIPATQQDGIAAVLGARAPVMDVVMNSQNVTWNLDQAMSLVDVASSIAKNIMQKIILTLGELNEMRQILKNAAQNLLNLAGQKDVPEEVRALIEAQDANTKMIMTKVRGQMDLSDNKIKSYKFNDLQKDVLRGNFVSSADLSDKGKEDVVDQAIIDDERLARTLQEVEVLSFLKKNKWKSFFKKPEPVIAEPVRDVPAVTSSPAISVK